MTSFALTQSEHDFEVNKVKRIRRVDEIDIDIFHWFFNLE
jgi:hypothetical protein